MIFIYVIKLLYIKKYYIIRKDRLKEKQEILFKKI